MMATAIPYDIEPRTMGEGLEDRDIRITHTWLGQDYGWDTLADVDWKMLRHNLASMQNVVEHPEKFPKADHVTLEHKCDALDVFLLIYGVGR